LQAETLTLLLPFVLFGPPDLHLVHKEVGGSRYAVLGFFLEPTSPSDIPLFSDLLTEWEATETAVLETCAIGSDAGGDTGDAVVAPAGGVRRLTSRQLPRSFSVYDLLPSSYSIYSYDGSLTTPPCSEVVYWNVVDQPVQLSVREYLRLTNLILDHVSPDTCESASNAAPSGFTGRPVQPINGRTITRVCQSSAADGSDGSASTSSSSTSAEPAEASSASAVATVGALASAVLSALLL